MGRRTLLLSVLVLSKKKRKCQKEESQILMIHRKRGVLEGQRTDGEVKAVL